MELALYCPVYGYYEKEKDIIGRRGDYYTSVSVGSLFGELLAFQFAEWLGGGELGSKAVQILEAGAYRGDLARDILHWLQRQRPELFERLEYRISEPSERRRRWQEQTLDEFKGKVSWAGGLAELGTQASPPPSRDASSLRGPSGGPAIGQSGGGSATAPPPRCPIAPTPGSPLRGEASLPARQIIFANELLDAFPVHRLGWDAKAGAWFEWGVTLREERLAWTRLDSDTTHLTRQPTLATLAPELAAVLPECFTVDVCPAAEEWWRSAADALGTGKLLTFDYGLTLEELLTPERRHGTLRAYHRHHLSDDVLGRPGEQDLTAHVNFSVIEAAGEAAGLSTETFVGQEQFLTRVASRAWQPEGRFGEWTAQRTRQFQTLTHPSHLGRAFRVLVQSRVTSDG